MKKLIVLVVLLLVTTPAFAGWVGGALNNLAAGSGEGTKDSVMYKLETYGNDVRVYEWTPRENKNVRCVFVAGNKNSTGVACYEVEQSKKK